MLEKGSGLGRKGYQRSYKAASVNFFQKIPPSILSLNFLLSVLWKFPVFWDKESGLNIKLVTEKGSELFKGFRKSYSLFVGVQNYIAMIGRNDLSNRIEKVKVCS